MDLSRLKETTEKSQAKFLLPRAARERLAKAAAFTRLSMSVLVERLIMTHLPDDPEENSMGLEAAAVTDDVEEEPFESAIKEDEDYL